jgi:hypothetical protein
MGALAFWKAVVEDHSDFLDRVIATLEDAGVRYCVIGGVAVNAYAEPLVTQDLDIVIATEDVERVRGLMQSLFRVREFDYTLNAYDPGSKLQVQFQLRPELQPALDHAERREVMDLILPVAAPRDLFKAKLAAATEPTRRPSKRGKDLLDLARLMTAFPYLGDDLPADLRTRVLDMVDREEDDSSRA